MKKTRLLIVTLSIGLLLTACSNNSKNASSSSSSSSSSGSKVSSSQTSSTSSSSSSGTSESSSSSSSAAASGINLTEILQSNFTSLEGTWKNGDGQTIQFENGKLISDLSNVVITVKPNNSGAILSVTSSTSGYIIFVYPAGTSITGLTDANNKIDQTGSADTSDKSKDRMLAGQDMPVYGTLNQEVYYRVSD